MMETVIKGEILIVSLDKGSMWG